MKSSFSFYIDKYSADLTRLCVSLRGNIDDAEDLFQETWLKAFKSFNKYDGERPFDKWLYTICVNSFKNKVSLFYNKKHHHFSSDEEMQQFFESLPDTADEAPDRYYELHKVVNELPRKQRAVLVLYYFRDHSVREVAEILGIPEGTVKSRLSSARQQIKRRLEHE